MKHASEVGFGLQRLGPRRLLGNVEAAFGTCHAVRALIEEVVSAKAMAEIVKAPWLAGSRCPIPDGVLINQNLDRTQVALEVSGALDRTRQPGRRHGSIVLRRCRRRVPKPGLQLEQRQRFLGVVELRRDRRACPVACDAAARVTSGCSESGASAAKDRLASSRLMLAARRAAR